MKKIEFIFIISLFICLINNISAQEVVKIDSVMSRGVVSDLVPDLENSAFEFSVSDRQDIDNTSKIDVMEALFGQISGLNVMQSNGFNSRVPSYSVHGLTPLLLVDGIPRNIENITLSEVEDVIVYKDAVASAIYGVRGGRGVINIITKKGRNLPKLEINTSYQAGVATKFRSPEFSDSYTYANALNMALIADGLTEKYSINELEAFKNGTYPEAYANVDWYNEVFSDYELSHQLNFNVRGGKDNFDYFALIEYFRNEGMFNYSNLDDRFNNQLLDTRLMARANIRFDVTKTTEIKLNMQMRLKEYNRPQSAGDIITAAYKTPSAAFPIKSSGVWGGDVAYGNINAVAKLSGNGHYKTIDNSLNLDVSLTQDFSMVTDGLSATALFAIDNSGSLYESSSLSYQYVDLNPSISSNGTLSTNPITYGTNSNTVGHSSGIDDTYFNLYFNTVVNYKRSFGDNNLDANLIFNMQSNKSTEQNNSYLRQSITAFAAYNNNQKYFVDLAVSYAGSSVIQLGDRFDIYPAVSGAWLMSEEDFFQSDIISSLKLRSSFGYSAYDLSTPYDSEKVYYSSGKDGYVATGTTGSTIEYSGWAESDLPTTDLELEKMRKFSVGAELGLFDSNLSFGANAFFNKRYNVLIGSSSTTSSILGLSVGPQNDGVYNYKGFDFDLDWKDQVGDFSYQIGATASFTASEIVENNEGYKPYDYLSKIGNSVNQAYGLEADGFFENQLDINNSPVQSFSTVSPGDIKYKDQNGDNIIDDYDVVKMCAPGVPELYYGFDLNLEYKNFSLYANFQGVGNYTISLLSSSLYKPLVSNYTISDTFLDSETFWTEANSSKATMPRLTTLSSENNYRASSQWYRDASYLKLRNVRVAYSFDNISKSLPFIEIYLTANNLFSIDEIEVMDPESISDGYPSVRSFYAGLNIKL